MHIICLFFPALLYCSVRNNIIENKVEMNAESIFKLLVEYVCGNIIINGLIILGRLLTKGNSGNIYTSITQYNDFAIKYVFLAIVLAILLPYIEKYVRDNLYINFEMTMKRKPFSEKAKFVMVLLIVLVFAVHYIIRMFDNSVWGDEGIVVGLVRKDWKGMLAGVAGNGHSPFHYAFAWICVKIFGESGFVFHLSASLPYFIILFLIISVIRKWFGNKTAIVFALLVSLLECAITYNMEIRMYAWCQLFMLLSYLMLYRLYKTNYNRYYVFLSVFSLGGVYSHYFAIAGIGLLYLGLFIYSIIEQKRNVWKVIVSGGTVLALFIPWLLYAKKVRGVVISNYIIGLVSWHSCIEFIFHSKYSMQILYTFFVLIAIWFIYDFNILSFLRNDSGKIEVKFKMFPKIKIYAEWAWVLSGIIAVFGTIVAAELISNVLYPIIVLRYLYQSYIIIWLLFAIAISKTKLSNVWTILFAIIIIITCYPTLLNTIQTEMSNNKRLESTLEATQPEIDEEDYIYTDIVHFAWTVENAYYPKTPNNLFGHEEWWGPVELPELDSDKQYWLFLSAPISEGVLEKLDNQNKQADLIVDNGYIGTGNVWIYKIIGK